jgi:hypothetical protein
MNQDLRISLTAEDFLRLRQLQQQLHEPDLASLLMHLVNWAKELGFGPGIHANLDLGIHQQFAYFKATIGVDDDAEAVTHLVEWFMQNQAPHRLWAELALLKLFVTDMPFDCTVKRVGEKGEIEYLWISPRLLRGDGGRDENFKVSLQGPRTAFDIWPNERAQQIEKWDKVVIASKKVYVHKDFFVHADVKIDRIGIRFPLAIQDGRVTLLGSLGIDCELNKLSIDHAIELLTAVFESNRK